MEINSKISLIALVSLLLLCGCFSPDSRPIASYRHAEKGIFAADVSADASLAVVAGIGNGIKVWDLKNNALLYNWNQGSADNELIGNIHISADNLYAVSADRVNFALWDLTVGEPVGFWRIDEASIRDLAVANQGKGILVGRANGKVMYFQPQTGRRIEFLGHQEKINSVDISPNGSFALSGGNDYSAYLWSTKSGQVIRRFTHPSRVTKVALDDQGRYAFTADSKKMARVWNVQTGAVISQLDITERQKIFTTVAFSKDGKYLLTGSPSRKVSLWNITTGKRLKQWKVAPRAGTSPRTAVVYGVGFLADSKILSESSSGLAEVWSTTELN